MLTVLFTRTDRLSCINIRVIIIIIVKFDLNLSGKSRTEDNLTD